MTGEIGFLLKKNDLRVGLDRAFAAIRLDPIVNHAQQRGLTRAIAANQRQPVARANMQSDIFEQPAAALLKAEVFPREDRRLCHARLLGAGAARFKLHLLNRAEHVTTRAFRDCSTREG